MRRREEVIQQAHALLLQGNAVYSIPTIPFQYQNNSCKLLNAINQSLQEKIELLKRGGLFVCWNIKQIQHFFFSQTYVTFHSKLHLSDSSLRRVLESLANPHSRLRTRLLERTVLAGSSDTRKRRRECLASDIPQSDVAASPQPVCSVAYTLGS